jgi:hypothetical protein
VRDTESLTKLTIAAGLEAISIVVVAALELEPFPLTVRGTTVLPGEVAAIEMTEKKTGIEIVNEIANETETETEIGKDIVVVTERVIVTARESREARVHSLMRMNVIVALCLFSNLLHV